MGLLVTVNVALTNVAAALDSLLCDSATFIAHPSNVGNVTITETATGETVDFLAPGDSFGVVGIRNLDRFTAVSSAVINDVLIIRPFLT